MTLTRLAGTTTVAALVLAQAGFAQVAQLGAPEGELNIVAWPGYIERGETDKAYDWVTKFEEATGCKVNVKTANTSDEMVALMNEGGFDLVTASGDASLRLVAGKRVQPVNPDLIPSWKNIDPRLQDAPWFTVDGKHYGVPYQWGPERADVFDRRLQGSAQELVGGVRGADAARTASRTRAGSRPTTARSTSPTPPST